MNPRISVIMPVYNGEKYLEAAIESVLAQTYVNFEFIIVDDGSKDGTNKIVNLFLEKDKRVVYLKNEKNLGISESLNKAIKKAKGEFIARMDADDICLPERLEKQIEYMKLNPDTDVLGTQFLVFSENINKSKEGRYLTGNILDAKSPVNHPTVLIKKELFSKAGYYRTKYNSAEDLDLWYRFYFKGARFHNLDERLLFYRVHTSNTSVKRARKQAFLALKLNLNAFFLHGIRFTKSGYLYILGQIMYLVFLTFKLNRFIDKKKVKFILDLTGI